MPASRSRTERWRDSLQQIAERGGGIEFSVARQPAISGGAVVPAEAPDLVWRVRLMGLSDTELLVEHPTAMGHSLSLDEGLHLVGVMAVGQNRWMFHTRVLGRKDGVSPWGKANGLRIAMPEKVERCHRRDFLRIATAELRLPHVECWPLLDPTSVVGAEVANRASIMDIERGSQTPVVASPDSTLLPEVGPSFAAKLMNIGGGGMGLVVDKSEASSAERTRLIWLRANLMPHIPAPLGMTARIVHSHLDSTMSLYMGVAFEFAFNPSHREFVVDQISRFVNRVQVKAKAA